MDRRGDEMAGLFDGTPLQRPVTCARCEKSIAECACPRDATGAILLPKDQPARVRREKRRGGQVTVIAGLDPAATDMKAMLRAMRSALGAGGSIGEDAKGVTIELQGDHRDRVLAVLREMGYPAKASGG